MTAVKQMYRAPADGVASGSASAVAAGLAKGTAGLVAQATAGTTASALAVVAGVGRRVEQMAVGLSLDPKYAATHTLEAQQVRCCSP